jgi:hypothetical protein
MNISIRNIIKTVAREGWHGILKMEEAYRDQQMSAPSKLIEEYTTALSLENLAFAFVPLSRTS